MKILHIVAFSLMLVGSLNWLLVGVFGWDIGLVFGGQMAWPSRIIYILVGLAAIAEIATHKKGCCLCSKVCGVCSAPGGSAPAA